MGHWAEIDANNIVQRVIVIKEAELDTGNWGDKSKWVKTSYNTRDGKHYVPHINQNFTQESSDQSKAIGYRFASVGMYYDTTHKAFYFKAPWASWTLNTNTFDCEPPIPLPELTEEEIESGKWYFWDESAYQADNTKGWILNE